MYFVPGGASGGLTMIFSRSNWRDPGRAAIGPEFAPDFILQDVAGHASAMGEQLLERHGSILLVHLAFEFGECLGEGAIPGKFALFNQHGAERGGHGLGAASRCGIGH